MADAATSPYCSWNQLYLPNITLPDHYDLEITSDLRSPPYSVSGSVQITLAPVEEVSPCIVIHAKGIKISAASLVVGDEEAGDVIKGEVYNKTEFEQVVLKFGEAVPLGPAKVSSASLRLLGGLLRALRFVVLGGSNRSEFWVR